MISEIIKNPNILIPRRHILLLSHMRANTSLFGHLIGSSDEVSGYYEMHIGYYSWKSLIRQKLLFHKANPKESVTKYYFDKILHSDHHVTDSILNNDQCSFIFMLRSPERTIQSVCKLYRRVEPEHEFTTVEGAAKYYIERINELGVFASKLEGSGQKYCYLDAECLIDNTDDTLAFLSDWIGLKEKLSPEYKQFELTGKEKYGDSSSNINHGRVSAKKENYDDIQISEKLLEECNNAYNSVREKLIAQCKSSFFIK